MVYKDETWRDEAQCKDIDTEIFFPPRDKDIYRTIAAEAKTYCFGDGVRPECPVRVDCLLYAINTDEVHGIWGGMSHRERNALLRKWKRGNKSNMPLRQYIEETSKKNG